MKNFVIAVLSVFAFPVFAFALANPASVKCIQDGGSLEVKTDATGGQYGECTLSSGKVCEEWAYYNGTCGKDTSASMSNPASAKCIQDGGSLTPGMEDGSICVFPDQRACEEWSYFRGECGGTFSDISNSPFKDDIHFIKDAGIVSGYADGTFKPDNTINRAEFTKIIIGSIFFQSELASCDVSRYGFSDVPKDAWFAPYVCLAKQEGIINGYADGTFKAGNTITLPEALKIITLAKKIDLSSYKLSENFSGNNNWDSSYLDYFLKKFEVPKIFNFSHDVDEYQMRAHHVSRGEMAYFINTLQNTSSDSEDFLEELLPEETVVEESLIPKNCVSWFDGCNTCSVENGVIGGCTKMACIQVIPSPTPYCKLYKDPVAPKDQDPLAGQVMVHPVYTNIPKNCTSWFDGCNTCSVQNGEAMACTLMACYSKDGLPTKTPQCLSY